VAHKWAKRIPRCYFPPGVCCAGAQMVRFPAAVAGNLLEQLPCPSVKELDPTVEQAH